MVKHQLQAIVTTFANNIQHFKYYFNDENY